MSACGVKGVDLCSYPSGARGPSEAVRATRSAVRIQGKAWGPHWPWGREGLALSKPLLSALTMLPSSLAPGPDQRTFMV